MSEPTIRPLGEYEPASQDEHSVRFSLDLDTYTVLSEALQRYASDERQQTAREDGGLAEQRRKLAELADELRDRVDQAG